MPLTVSWWEAEKKAHGKKAPATGLAAVLKKYETARGAMDKTPTAPTCDAARKALTAVSTTIASAFTKLKDDKWKDLCGSVGKLKDAVKKDDLEITAALGKVGLGAKIDKAESKEEALYEGLFHAFEKQRNELDTAPSKQQFKIFDVSIDKLIIQAQKAGRSSPHLLGKYNQQEKVLTSLKGQTKQKGIAYEQAIAACVKARQDLVPVFQSAEIVLTRTKGQLGGVKAKALEAKQANNQVELVKCKKVAEMLGKGAQESFNKASEAFKPGTMVRDATDVKAAKIHSSDSITDISPHSSKIFEANKVNNTLNKEVQTAASEIAKL